MRDQSERDVAAPLSKDQAERLTALFDAHAERLYKLARRLARNPDEALDLVQDAFVRAARSPESIPRSAGPEEAWLVRVLVNLQRDRWRRQAVRRRYAGELRGVSGDHDPRDVTLIRTAVWQALDRLSPRRRAIVVMHEIEGLSARAIASLLGISAITVRWHLSRGRRELARQLDPRSGETDERPLEEPLAGRRPRPSRSSAS
jgi:RNA polymerase sigma-70 factor (ECF subfamily)